MGAERTAAHAEDASLRDGVASLLESDERHCGGRHRPLIVEIFQRRGIVLSSSERNTMTSVEPAAGAAN